MALKSPLRQLAESLPCPVCTAKTDGYCVTPTGLRRNSPHNDRFRLAQAILDGKITIEDNRRTGSSVKLEYPDVEPQPRKISRRRKIPPSST